ncbi:MAG: hypothetical protein QXI32_03925 [Candidatus Bathyarchaeia archaeon]
MEFTILTLCIAYTVVYGHRLLQGDFSPIVFIYIFSSVGVAIWLYKIRREELRQQNEQAFRFKATNSRAKHYSQMVEEKETKLRELIEKYRRGEIRETEYSTQRRKIEEEISEFTKLDTAVFEAKQRILKELARNSRVSMRCLLKTIGNPTILEEAIAELLEEGLLKQTGPDEYRYNYSNFGI